MTTDYRVKVDTFNGCVDIIADDGGPRHAILAVHGEMEQAEILAYRVAAMLKAHDARVEYDAGRTNSMSAPDPRDIPAVVGDAQGGDRAGLEASAAQAEKVAGQWDAYAESLLTLLAPPGLPMLTGFDQELGKLSIGRGTIPRPTYPFNGDDDEDIARLVGGAVINASTYRRHAAKVRAYVADQWGHEDTDASPRGEADILH